MVNCTCLVTKDDLNIWGGTPYASSPWRIVEGQMHFTSGTEICDELKCEQHIFNCN